MIQSAKSAQHKAQISKKPNDKRPYSAPTFPVLAADQQIWKNNDVGPQRLLGTMTTYREAVDEFSQNATEFLEDTSLLTQARDAYQRAMALSTELRNILDSGDETLQTLMAQLEQAVNAHLGKADFDKKKPETVKVEPIKANGENSDGERAEPRVG